MQISNEGYHVLYNNEGYHVLYNSEAAIVSFYGALHLCDMQEYQPITNLLWQAAEQCPSLTIDLTNLEFMNSSGINMLLLFVIKVRDRGDVQLIFQGSNQILWQTKSLRNLQRLMPALKLELSDPPL